MTSFLLPVESFHEEEEKKEVSYKPTTIFQRGWARHNSTNSSKSSSN